MASFHTSCLSKFLISRPNNTHYQHFSNGYNQIFLVMGLRYNILVPPTGADSWLPFPSPKSVRTAFGRSVVRLRHNLFFFWWIDYQIILEMLAPCLPCPSASLVVQHGGCVPRERLAAKGLMNYCDLTEAISDIVFEYFLVSPSSNPNLSPIEVLSKEATVALSVVGAILFLCIVLGFAFFCFIRHQRKQIVEYRNQLFPVYTGKHQVKYHVKRA